MTRSKIDLEAATKAARLCIALEPEVLKSDISARQRTQLLRMMARTNAPDEAVEWALAGDRMARQACMEAAAKHISEGRALPGTLANFIAAFLGSAAKKLKGKRGHDPEANIARDLRIVLAVCAAAEKGGLRPTRNDAAQDKSNAAESACSIVARVLSEFGLHLSEGGVARIWRQHKHLR
jgi:hypothetical protein